MISFKSSNKMTDRPVVALLPLGKSFSFAPAFQGTGLPGAAFAPVNERPTKASAVAALAQAPAYAMEATTNGAGSLNARHQQHLTMWAFRGLEPWRDPA
ncbi:hypothetical protein [Streptomyces sp. UNOC14_S4]|uniref:hypothetical protein n=1 Tax=Streptomyces sp. UNOC14_S4 TaxID=2872340 RepID=UPI001E401C78|nr:hypothetical protein [Streptomyces sp. UNOC14_S4]MCC3767433.1 hypothetical protein [Streptomyces sp. UNOC14_S4]